MARVHLDRLSSVDAGFLHQEDGGDAHMHIGGLAILAGAAPQGRLFRDHVASRLHLIPRYRQKLAFPPLQSGRPLWVDDPDFKLSYHVRHTALPRPGSEEQLLTLTARILSQRLDRTKPLWEVWLVEGLQDDRWAMIDKTHHAMVDGVSGVDILTALFDLSADAPPGEPEPWSPCATPGAVELLQHGAAGAVRTVGRLTARGLGSLAHPRRAVGETFEAVRAVAEVTRPLIDAAPRTPINVRPGPHRRVAVVRTRLSDYKAVKNAHGGTVNDVVLTAVAGALGTFLAARGVATEDLTLRACVPVSLRTSDAPGALGNEIAIMVAPLAVGIADPVERLAVVRSEMEKLKLSRQAQGAQVLTEMENFMPPTVLAQASRLGFSSRLYNLLVTNVSGPQFPVYLLGRPLVELFPLPFLAPEHALAVAAVSYDCAVNIGLLGDHDAVPDIDVLAAAVGNALGELVASAAAPAPPSPRRAVRA